MKILTCAMSPYVNLSNGKLNAWILKHLYFHNHSVASVVWAHDISYYIPEVKDGKSTFYFEFQENDNKHKIPLMPINRSNRESVAIYEILNQTSPDVFITIGDLSDHQYMHAIKSFCTKKVKWLAVLTNYQHPLQSNMLELVRDMDAVICTSNRCFQEVKQYFVGNNIELAYVGSQFSFQEHPRRDGFKVMSIGKNSQSDNLPLAMEAMSSIGIAGLDYYVHTNIYDSGELNLTTIKDRLNCNTIRFPEQYVALCDGVSDQEMQKILSSFDILLSTSMVSGSAMSIFDGILCGCLPLMTDCDLHAEIAEIIEKELYPEFSKDDFLIRSIKISAIGETYLHICDPEDLKNKLIALYEKQEKYKGRKKEFIEAIKQYGNRPFLRKVARLVSKLDTNEETIMLEQTA